MKSGFLTIISSVKDNGLTKIRHTYQIRKQASMEKNIVYVVGLSWNIQLHHDLMKSHLTNAADIYIQQLQRVKEKLHEKRPTLVNYQNVFFYSTMHYRILQALLKNQFSSFSGLFYHIHLIFRIWHRQVITFFVPYRIF